MTGLISVGVGVREKVRLYLLFTRVRFYNLCENVPLWEDPLITDFPLTNSEGNVCGSSGGSGVAAFLSLAPITLGTETGWSISCVRERNIPLLPTTRSDAYLMLTIVPRSALLSQQHRRSEAHDRSDLPYGRGPRFLPPRYDRSNGQIHHGCCSHIEHHRRS